jgi:hypothetical protein
MIFILINLLGNLLIILVIKYIEKLNNKHTVMSYRKINL